MRRVIMKNKTDQMQMALLRQWNLAKLENRMKSLAKSDSWFIDPIFLFLLYFKFQK